MGSVRDRVADRVLRDLEGHGDGADEDLDDLRRQGGRATLGCRHCTHEHSAGAGQSVESGPLGLSVADLLHSLLHTCCCRGLVLTGYLRDWRPGQRSLEWLDRRTQVS